MKIKIASGLGLLAGYIAWQMVGGIGGLLLACILVAPLTTTLLTALFSSFDDGNITDDAVSDGDKDASPDERETFIES